MKLLNLPIGMKIFLGFFLLLIVILLLVWQFVNTIYADVLKKNEVQYNLLASDKTKSQFDMTISLITSTASTLADHHMVNSVLMDIKPGSPSEFLENTGELYSLLQSTLVMQPFIENIHIISPAGYSFSGIPGGSGETPYFNYNEYFTYAKSGEGSEFWSGGYDHLLSYIRPVYKANPREVIGLVVININYDFVRQMFMASAIMVNERVLIVNKSGQIVFNFPHFTSYSPFLEGHPELLTAEKLQIEDKVYGLDSIIVSESINMSDWKIIRLIDKKSITKETNRVNRVLLNVILLSAALGVLYSLWLASFITKPIRTLAEACHRAEQGDLSVRVKLRGRDELGELGGSFNMMILRIKESFDKELDDQKRKGEMRFQILQAQINPHFLYNTLDSIKWLAVMQNVSNIAEMSTALINLLKYNLTRADSSTTLLEEVESVRHYVRIQRFRFSDNFDFTTQLSDDTLSCRVIRFILQPLVENSIIHGFQDVEDHYQIRIASYISDGNLHIKIIDNGSGMNPETTNAVNRGIDGGTRYNHIGVANIRDRIKLHFGEQYGLSYSSVPFVGTIAEVVLPNQTETGEEV